MESTRQKKISRLLQKELASIFQQEAPALYGNIFFTITEVITSTDLSVAKVYVSIFPVKESEVWVKNINEKASYFRNILAKKIRHQIRVVPQLQFFLDNTAGYAEEINQLLQK